MSGGYQKVCWLVCLTGCGALWVARAAVAETPDFEQRIAHWSSVAAWAAMPGLSLPAVWI